MRAGSASTPAPVPRRACSQAKIFLKHWIQTASNVAQNVTCNGSNFVWHNDKHNELKPFGFCIPGAIDEYSRRILWLEVGSSNNNPRINIVGKYFLDCVVQVGETPRIRRGNAGAENVNIAPLQRFFWDNAADAFQGDKSFLYGKSVSNQRIEGWWTFLSKSESD